MTARATPALKPGAFVAEVLEAKGWTQTKLADVLGLSTTYVNDIVRGHRGISPLVALRLEAALLHSARFWMDLQRDWDLEQRTPGLDEELAAIRERAAGA